MSQILPRALALVLLATTFIAAPSTSASANEAGPTPEIIEVSPAALQAGGEVRIIGKHFFLPISVKFGSLPALRVELLSDEELVAEVPTGAGLVNLTIQTLSGSTTSYQAFLHSPPTSFSVSSVTPSSVPVSGNREVAIEGSGLNSVTAIEFGDFTVTEFQIVSSSRIVFNVPPNPGGGNLSLAVYAGEQRALGDLQLNWEPTCEFDQLASVQFSRGSVIVSKASRDQIKDAVQNLISGECPAVSLGTFRKKATSNASTAELEYLALSSSRALRVRSLLSKLLEENGHPIPVRIRALGIESGEIQNLGWDSAKQARIVTVSSTRAKTVHVANLFPRAGVRTGGQQLIISGSNLDLITGVRFGKVPAQNFEVLSPNSMSITTPQMPSGMRILHLKAKGGKYFAAASFRFQSPPVLTALSSASSGLAGSKLITLSGKGFFETKSIKFGDSPASYRVNSSTSISVQVPANSSGEKLLTLATSAGTATAAFQYFAAPSIASVSPDSGVSAGNTEVEILGANLAQVRAPFGVTFGELSARAVLSQSDQRLVVTTGRSNPGEKPLTVSSPFGSTTKLRAFVFGGTINPAVQQLFSTVGLQVTPTQGFSPDQGFAGSLTYLLSGGALPSGLSFSTTTGVITGTPNQFFALKTFTITAVGSEAGLAVALVAISSSEVSPVLQNLAGTVGQPMPPSMALTVGRGFAGETRFQLASGSLPQGLSLSSSTGVITGTPTEPFSAAELRIRATGSQSGSAEVLIMLSIATDQLSSSAAAWVAK